MRMDAGFEVDIERPIASKFAGGGERFLLGMELTMSAMEALSSQVPIRVQYHRAHHRIRARPEVGLARQIDGACGPMQVYARIRICCRQTRWQYTFHSRPGVRRSSL